MNNISTSENQESLLSKRSKSLSKRKHIFVWHTHVYTQLNNRNIGFWEYMNQRTPCSMINSPTRIKDTIWQKRQKLLSNIFMWRSLIYAWRKFLWKSIKIIYLSITCAYRSFSSWSIMSRYHQNSSRHILLFTKKMRERKGIIILLNSIHRRPMCQEKNRISHAGG